MIDLHNVSKTVLSGSESLTILKETTIRLEPGSFSAIVGPSGSGKSTMLALIAGLDAPTTGQILVAGNDITRMREDELAAFRGRTMGIVFQSFHLIPSLTALENVSVAMEIAGRKDAMRRARSLLAGVGLAQREGHYPSQLSGGEQQRVAIARAIANDPPILLADEPTGNLDSATGAQIVELLTEINERRGTTLLLVTHEPSLAARAGRTIALADGVVVRDERRIEALEPVAPGAAESR
jgi:putative ABC transport system ATP-binding protein